jgi:hypothetical protein
MKHMKRYILLPLLAAAIAVQAQDSYMNERLVNSSSDVIGTSRYVGMGGALGALGADISVISWNPAGIGLYRKNDIALTMGGLWGKSHISEENRGKFTFDQAGFVLNVKTGGETCPYVNFSFNYQKKINFNHNFYADNPNLHELSQLDQLAELTDWDNGTENLEGMAWDNGFFGEKTLVDASGNPLLDEEGKEIKYRYNQYSSDRNEYTHHSEGSLQSFDFNVSTNVNDRAFFGLTIGVDNMRYRGWNYYREYYMPFDFDGKAKYDVENYDINISGTGVNVKLGTIIRPFEDKPFRFGFVVETPTWYRLKNSTWFDMVRQPNNLGSRTEAWESYLKFNIRSPWKLRTSIGSTIGSTLAWDVDYEYSAFRHTSMGYPENIYADGSTSGNVKDKAMNQMTRDNMRGTHTLRIGLEANATKNLAFRLGYNLSTSAYNKHISFDQYNLNSYAMDYATGTNFMRLGHTNILTLGAGYHTRSFYIDLAYKIRHQKADFYAFDTNFTNTNQELIPQFVLDNPALADVTIDPVGVDLTRQTITCTLGFKF